MDGKLELLKSILRDCGRSLIAYSGGVDSVLLAKVAHDVLGADSLAAIADSPSLPRRELQEALDLGNQFGFPVRVVRTEEMMNSSYTGNPVNRCYFCKSELFAKLTELARREGWQTLVYGENASDAGDHRPGAQAAAEFRVRAPLREAGLSKDDIRALSRQLGLPTADKPQMACLSSRIPYGDPVTPEALFKIEQAEYALRDLGFFDVRVRHHNTIARIEVGPDELGRFLDEEIRVHVDRRLREIGYAHVTLDLRGYRRGSINEILVNKEASVTS